MPPLSSLPGDIDRWKLLNALARLEFKIDMSGGNGSHCKITWSPSQKAITVKKNLHKCALKYLLDQIEEYSGITWEDIKKVY
jgi:hypothetical protein